jgi:competence protein ComEA
MKKREKLIGSLIILICATIFLIVGYKLDKSSVSEPNVSTDSSMDNDIFQEQDLKTKGVNLSSKNEGAIIDGIKVEIRGAVKMPGVYDVSAQSRISDLISKAGGLKEDADLSKIPSMARKLKDEELIYILKQGEEIDTEVIKNQNVSVNKDDNDGLVNINAAPKEKLMTLTGVGEVTANKIIEYREKNGLFKTKEDIKNVDRIGDKTYQKFQDKIKVK